MTSLIKYLLIFCFTLAASTCYSQTKVFVSECFLYGRPELILILNTESGYFTYFYETTNDGFSGIFTQKGDSLILYSEEFRGNIPVPKHQYSSTKGRFVMLIKNNKLLPIIYNEIDTKCFLRNSKKYDMLFIENIVKHFSI